MGYADSLLADGERIVLRERQHWLSPVVHARNSYLAFIVAIILFWLGNYYVGVDGAAGTLRQVLGIVTFVLVIGGLVWLAWVLAGWYNEAYMVTNRRVIKLTGLLNKHAADSSLEKINDAELDQSLLGRILGYGDLDIMTAAETEVDKFKMLHNAVDFKIQMLNQKHELEFEGMRPPVGPPLRSSGVSSASSGPAAAYTATGDVAPMPAKAGAAAAASPAPAAAGAARGMTPAEVTQTLNGLADLRDRGAITPDEFEAKKADLLGRL